MTIKKMTKADKAEYIKGAIAEVKRVAKIYPRFTYFEYQEFSRYPYKGEQIRDATGLKLNEIKKLAGLKIRTQRGKGTNNKHRGQGKYTDRNCNMEHCLKPFKALDDMYSCPACDNAKKHGENSSAGLDEFNLGCIGGINK